MRAWGGKGLVVSGLNCSPANCMLLPSRATARGSHRTLPLVGDADTTPSRRPAVHSRGPFYLNPELPVSGRPQD